MSDELSGEEWRVLDFLTGLIFVSFALGYIYRPAVGFLIFGLVMMLNAISNEILVLTGVKEDE